MVEAERLYLVNCGICHGTKLDGNGPLYKGGDGPFPAKPATLVGDEKYEAMPEGQMFYSVTYGKNKMGSYASQLDTRQRWMVIAYIKSKQAAALRHRQQLIQQQIKNKRSDKYKNYYECQLKNVLKFLPVSGCGQWD